MPRKLLTNLFIEQVKPKKKEVEYYDTKVTGLIFRVTTTGNKSYSFRFRYNGKNKRKFIGSHTIVSLREARDMAKKMSYDTSIGDYSKLVNPPRKESQVSTFRDLAEKYMAVEFPSLRPKTIKEHSRIIQNELIPFFGDYSISDISKAMIIEFLDTIAVNRGKITMANRIRTRLHTIFQFGVDRGILALNPVSSIRPRKGEKSKDRFYSVNEIKILWDAFCKIQEPTQSVFKLLLILGQRTTETSVMKWSELTEDFKIWTITTEVAKNKIKHFVYLPSLAIEVIRNRSKVNFNKEYVFPSPIIDNKPIENHSNGKRKVRKLSGITDFTGHDLRHTFGTHMARIGVREEVVSKLLNHNGKGGGRSITKIYIQHEYTEERKQAMEQWNNELLDLIK